jgi:hypothetical protein
MTKSLLSDFNVMAREAAPFCCYVRAEEQQVEFAKKFQELAEKIEKERKIAKNYQDEESANAFLSIREMASAVMNELEMWVCLKRQKFNDAWEKLVRAQIATQTAQRAHDIGFAQRSYENKVEAIEKLIFPPQVFFSPGLKIKEAECSICGRSYDDCEHVVGRAYMGEMCARIIRSAEIVEVSIVDEPANKLARIQRITDGGTERDYLTWLPIQAGDKSRTDDRD